MHSTRIQQYKAIARKLDMSFQETDDWGLKNQLADFRLFQKGGRKRVRNILRKQDGMMNSDIRVFDYRYLVSTGKSTRRIEQTVFFIESKKLSLSEFRMRPENIFHKLIEWFGAQDIDFEEFPNFSYEYQLQGEEESLIRDQFNDKILKFFSIEKGWTMEGIGFYLILYKKGHLINPSFIPAFYKKGVWLGENF